LKELNIIEFLDKELIIYLKE